MIDRDLITVLYRLIASKTTNITAKYLAVQNGGYEWHLASHTILPPLSIKTSTPSLPVSSMTLLCNDVIADLLSISIMCSATIITTSTMMASSSKYWMLPITLSATVDSAISCTTSCTGWTFLRGCSTSCVQRSIDVCSTKSTTVHDALLHPHLRHVRSSGLFCSWPSGLELVTRLPARSITLLWRFSPGPENFSFLVLPVYTVHHRLCDYALCKSTIDTNIDTDNGWACCNHTPMFTH